MAHIFQPPNKRLITAIASGAAMLLFRKNRLLSMVSRLLFVTSLRQWSKAEYISGANKFRKGLGAAGLFITQAFAAYRRRMKRK